MSKKKKSGNGNLLLLAGLGAGALLLFAGKSNAATTNDVPGTVTNDATGIPDAPKILAVNTQSTESPLPTGIVSDEEGMEVTSSSPVTSGGGTKQYALPAAPSDSSEDGLSIEQTEEYKEIPPLVSTKLTPKEKEIIDKGKLSAVLAIKRPDLYKAAYIKRHGGKTQAGKKKALAQANAQIKTAVAAEKAARTGGLKKAVAYPAKPQYTFVQSAGQMASQAAIAQVAATHKAGVKRTPVAGKAVPHPRVVKGSKGKHPVRHSSTHPAHPAKKHPVHPGAKRTVKKH